VFYRRGVGGSRRRALCVLGPSSAATCRRAQGSSALAGGGCSGACCGAPVWNFAKLKPGPVRARSWP